VIGVIVVIAAVAIGIGIAFSGGDERGSPERLDKPTDARRRRPLRPGPTPGFAPSELEREKHSEND
jgi:hypothetical protein